MENRKKITMLAPAKINVCLGVTGKRPDGYHDIDSVMQTVSLFDKVKVSLAENPKGKKIEVFCPGFDELNGENDIAYGMAQIFFEYTKTENYDVYIEIEKVIPMEAGLGGGSSDAAAVLLALNELTGEGLSEGELTAIGAKVGADIPFLLHKGTAFVGGIGEIITPCRDLPETAVLIAYPKSEKVSTGKAYKAIWQSGFANFGRIDKKRLYMLYASLVPEPCSNIKITLVPNTGERVTVGENGEFSNEVLDFSALDFSDFTFECEGRPTLTRHRIRLRRFDSVRLIIENSYPDSRATVERVVIS